MVSHALLRTRRLNTDVFIAFDYKQIKNISLGKTTSFDKLREIQLGFDFDYVDQFDGRNVGDMSVNVGIPDFLGGLKPVDKECSRKGAGGRFAIFYLDAQRLQRFARHSLLVFNFSGQATSYKLPLAEQFYIGGVDTVRGYPLASALGDSGYFANLECRIPPPGLADRLCPFSKRKWKEVLQFLGFVDHGGVFLNGRSNERQSSPIFETSAGFGLRIFGPYRLDFCFDVGFPITAKKSISIPIYYYRINLQAF
jgi:hemolysin activation/secretion protein